MQLRDVGSRTLRDLDAPEQLFELVIDGTEAVVRPGTIRVLIADDQALVRSGFRMILETQKGSRSSATPRTAWRRCGSRRS